MSMWLEFACVGFGVSTLATFLLFQSFLPVWDRVQWFGVCWRRERSKSAAWRQSQAITERSTGPHEPHALLSCPAPMRPSELPEDPMMESLRYSVVYWILFAVLLNLWLWSLSRLLLCCWIRYESKARLQMLWRMDFIEQVDSDANWAFACICVGNAGLFGVVWLLFPLVHEAVRAIRDAIEEPTEIKQLGKRRLQAYMLMLLATTVSYSLVQAWAWVYTDRRLALACRLLLNSVYFVALMHAVASLVWIRKRYRVACEQSVILSSLRACIQRLTWTLLVLFLSFHLIPTLAFWSNCPISLIHFGAHCVLLLQSITGLLMAIFTAWSRVCWYHNTRISASLLLHSFRRKSLCGQRPSQRDSEQRSPSAFPLLPVFCHTRVDLDTLCKDRRLIQQARTVQNEILSDLLEFYHGHTIASRESGLDLAFHTIRDAFEFALRAQLEVFDTLFSQKFTSSNSKTTPEILASLGVGIALHDAHPCEGELTLRWEAGQVENAGPSAYIAHKVGQLAHAGQVLVTERVAEWLCEHGKSLCEPYAMNFIASHELSVGCIRLYQVYRTRSRVALQASELKVLESSTKGAQSPCNGSSCGPDRSISASMSLGCSIPMLASPPSSSWNEALEDLPTETEYQDIVVVNHISEASARRFSRMIFI